MRLAHIYNETSDPVALVWIDKALIAATGMKNGKLKMAEATKIWIQVDLGSQADTALSI